jgi:hypothetical protein
MYCLRCVELRVAKHHYMDIPVLTQVSGDVVLGSF